MLCCENDNTGNDFNENNTSQFHFCTTYISYSIFDHKT